MNDTRHIMDELNYNLDELPVLTEIATPQSITLASAGADVVALRLSVTESDPDGYDPYNSAPPLPAEQKRY